MKHATKLWGSCTEEVTIHRSGHKAEILMYGSRILLYLWSMIIFVHFEYCTKFTLFSLAFWKALSAGVLLSTLLSGGCTSTDPSPFVFFIASSNIFFSLSFFFFFFLLNWTNQKKLSMFDVPNGTGVCNLRNHRHKPYRNQAQNGSLLVFNHGCVRNAFCRCQPHLWNN